MPPVVIGAGLPKGMGQLEVGVAGLAGVCVRVAGAGLVEQEDAGSPPVAFSSDQSSVFEAFPRFGDHRGSRGRVGECYTEGTCPDSGGQCCVPRFRAGFAQHQ